MHQFLELGGLVGIGRNEYCMDMREVLKAKSHHHLRHDWDYDCYMERIKGGIETNHIWWELDEIIHNLRVLNGLLWGQDSTFDDGMVLVFWIEDKAGGIKLFGISNSINYGWWDSAVLVKIQPGLDI